MLVRLFAVLLAAFAGLPAPAAAAPPPSPTPASAWPYPAACLETGVTRLMAWRNAEPNTIDVVNLVGFSRPCASNPAPVKGVRLALTQYNVTDGVVHGWMGSPWQTNSIGDMTWRRTGTISGDLAAMCLSTGLTGDVAENAYCFRPVWTEDQSEWDVETVPLDDPIVTSPLERIPAPGDSAPAGCGNCLITDPVAPLPEPETLPAPGTVVPGCTRLRLDSAGMTSTGAVRLTGSVRACAPDTLETLGVGTVFYGVHGGRLGNTWSLDEGGSVVRFDRAGPLRTGEEAVCVTSGRQQTDDGSYAHHLACVAAETNSRGVTRVVRIPNNDPRVLKPVDVVWDGDPPGTCITCL
jgi:hypothetical protein